MDGLLDFDVLYLVIIKTLKYICVLTTLTYILYKPWRPKIFFQFEIVISKLFPIQFNTYVVDSEFATPAIKNVFILSVRGSALYVRIWRLSVDVRSKDGPRAVRVNARLSLTQLFWRILTTIFLILSSKIMAFSDLTPLQCKIYLYKQWRPK